MNATLINTDISQQLSGGLLFGLRHSPQMMNCGNSGDPLTFHIVVKSSIKI